jgi:hypothetical protein
MDKIKIYYQDKMVPQNNPSIFSNSPQKPKLFIEHLNKLGLDLYFQIHHQWNPFTIDDFKLIHDSYYVDAFFNGKKPLCESNNMSWSKEFSETVKYTNASLYHAILESIQSKTITLSPTSGFHHAMPNKGLGFCTFAGQVLASYKLYKEFGFVGAYIDLDGHYGNSIEDFKEHSSVSDVVSQSIKFNINPKYNHREYINDLKESLEELKLALLNNEIHYVVFCHGADSHEYDDGWNGNEKGQCTTEEWVECSSIVYSFIRDMKVKYNKDIPLCISLFGGYRQDNYENVLNLHAKDIIQAINIFYNSNIEDKLEITEPDLVFNVI